MGNDIWFSHARLLRSKEEKGRKEFFADLAADRRQGGESSFHLSFRKKETDFCRDDDVSIYDEVSREKKPNKNAAVADNDDVHGVCYLVGGPNFVKSSQLLGLGIVRIKSGRDGDEGERGGP